MEEYNSRESIYEAICNASRQKYLGFFVGSGFTKSILENNTDYEAYNWIQLLEKCCDKMGVNAEILNNNCSCPEIATNICRQYSSSIKCTYPEAVEKLQKTICQLVNVFPDQQKQDEYSEYFKEIEVNWFVTTNYDTILENILSGEAFPISPTEYFLKVGDMIPVYHIHGIRTLPESVVITNDDYARLFRPNDYCQTRLPFLIKESLVVMLGYGLGDINVLAAIDWSKNVFTHTNENYDFPIIQLLWKENNPKKDPYTTEQGVTILEIASVDSFFKELMEHYDDHAEKYEELRDRIADYYSMFLECDTDTIEEFIRNTDKRLEIIQFISKLPQHLSYLYSSYLTYLRVVIAQLDELSDENGAFEAYNQKLVVILDILENIEVNKMPIAFFSYLADSFGNLARYIGKIPGCSFSAYDTWMERQKEIPKETVEKLIRHCEDDSGHKNRALSNLLKKINESQQNCGNCS